MTNRHDLVLIPGLACTGELYAPQIAALSEIARLHVADHTVAASMADVARVILASAPATFALCGLSMGGYIALEIMRQAPERVTRLALLDTSAKPDTPQRSIERRAQVAFAEQHGIMAGVPMLMTFLVHPRRVADLGLVDVVSRMTAHTGVTHYARQQEAIISRADSRLTLRAIKVPTLVLVGREDALTPVTEAQEIAAGIPGATLTVIEDCGHLSTLEQPDAVTRALRHWLGA